jgi:hypothetical protein
MTTALYAASSPFFASLVVRLTDHFTPTNLLHRCCTDGLEGFDTSSAAHAIGNIAMATDDVLVSAP